MAEFLPDYEASGWFGIGAPKNTPYEIIDKLNKEINAGLDIPNGRGRSPTSTARRSPARQPTLAS